MSGHTESYRVEQGQPLSGELTIPGDKSISHRAVMLGGIAAGTTTIRGFLDSEDCLATLTAFDRMGVTHRSGSAGELIIEGVGPYGLTAPATQLDLGNSGTAMRLLLGLLAGQRVRAQLTGDESLRSRPMERIAAPLRAMGAQIETTSGRAPVTVSDTPVLRGIDYSLPVASAQIKSAILLAGLGATGSTRIRSPGPSRDHTERMLRTMGVELTISADGQEVELTGPATLRAASIDVPADFSSAAFFIVGGCLAGSGQVRIGNVGINPTRIGLLRILERMGARIAVTNQRWLGEEPVADIVAEPSRLQGAEIGDPLVSLAIDELPLVFVAAALAEGRTVVREAAELRVKETDRIAVMAEALRAVGVSVQELDDGMIVDGSGIDGGSVNSRGDHRVAMAFAIAALGARGPIEVQDTKPIATSFPGFVATAAAAGLQIDVRESAAS